MIEEGIVLPVSIVAQGKPLNSNEPSVLLIRAYENVGVAFDVCCAKAQQRLHINHDCLLLIDREQIKAVDGTLVFRKLRSDMLSKLLAFVDSAAFVDMGEKRNAFLKLIDIDNTSQFFNKEQIEKWFLSEYLKQDYRIQPLYDLLRRTECYALVRYLVNGTESNLNLHDLGKLYGLSYSHFRRLCRNALGGKVKTELCVWRMARCILEIIEGTEDMTTVAYKYGYSSSSHFSSEVRNRLGISPRKLCRRSEK